MNYELGPLRCCYANAFALASEHSDLRYVEGYCTTWGSDTWKNRHGWCIDEDDQVVDPTWGTGRLPLAYRGIVLPLDIAEPHAKPFSHGTIDGGMMTDIPTLARLLGFPWPPTPEHSR